MCLVKSVLVNFYQTLINTIFYNKTFLVVKSILIEIS